MRYLNTSNEVQKPANKTYCFDALVKNWFMDETEFAKFTDKFDVSQHFELCNGTLLLLLRGEWVVMFVKDYKK